MYPHVLGYARKRAPQALTLDVLEQSVGHLPLVVFVRHRLHKRLPAGLAAIAAAVKHDTCSFAVHGGIHDNYFTAAKANDLGMITVGAVCRWFGFVARLRRLRAKILL